MQLFASDLITLQRGFLGVCSDIVATYTALPSFASVNADQIFQATYNTTKVRNQTMPKFSQLHRICVAIIENFVNK